MDKSLLHENEPLKKHSTFRVGGNARYFYEARSTSDIPELINWAKSQNLPYIVIGGGSNVLFKDEGFDGLVIKMVADHVDAGDEEIVAEAGAKITKVAKMACDLNLGGIEEFVYLPGTVGGAVYGNAGCFGKEMKDALNKVWILDEGKIVELDPEALDLGYRHSNLKGTKKLVLKASFRVHPECDKAHMEEILAQRKDRQPPGMSGGSFFKNPGDKSAGQLIDECGLKGKTVGGAQISDKHANFILNTGNATAADILELAEMAKKAVAERFGIALEREIQVIG